MAKSPPASASNKSHPKPESYVRFQLPQRFEHLLLLLSFSTLAITGLAQRYATVPVGELTLRLLGGIETARTIHHFAAITMMFESIYHIVAVAYRVLVKRGSLSILPVPEDLKHLLQDILFYLRLRKHKGYYGRYSYAEKIEYLAVVWGTIIMGITGFMLWNPISTARWLPGEFIPAAKIAHSNEAVLAVLAILLWHFYNVHVRSFNKSMFTGRLTREEMEHEHPAELALIEEGKTNVAIPPKVIRRRQRIFFPIALLLTVALTFGVYAFISLEETAISTVPRAETAQVYAPRTPTAAPTAIPSPTPSLGDVQPASWEGSFGRMLNNRCSTCHGITAVGGVSFATYEDALADRPSGPAIVPGDPEASVLVKIQAQGNHPGQLTIDELNQVIEWIEAGAPRR
jgi:cytochrome b subunit of formate dehydrogenase/mono/diheme cytochrome c family protein